MVHTAAEEASPSRDSGDRVAPHRVLVLSADMGGGHNATAAALEESVERCWTGSEILRLDALDVMGPGVGRLFRKIYVSNVETTPWLYEFFYANLWRHRWFARASKRFTGSWCGRRLADHIDHFDPDLVVSTYPLASSGLAWLRLQRGLEVPSYAWISDFAPHPFWVYRELDGNFVMHQAAVPVALAAEPEARVKVSPPPVVRRFHPGDRAAARQRLGLRPEALVVLLSCGSYAFGDTEAMVGAMTGASDNVTVLAVCGKDADIQRKLDGMGIPERSLVTFGWVDDMPTLTLAADLVVTNAGGATALEAIATGTPLVCASPIAAHGAANANLMTVAGLSELCADLDGLTALIRATGSHRDALDPLRARTVAHAADGDLDHVVRPLGDHVGNGRGRSLPERPWRMRAADAFFGHVERPGIAQEVGVVLELDPLPGGEQVTAAAVAAAIQPRMAGLPTARRVLSRRPLGWRLVDGVRVLDHVDDVTLPEDATETDLWRTVSGLWGRPLPAGRPGWRMLVVRAPHLGRSLLGVKLHHSHGDGISALGLMDRLLDTADGDPLRERRPGRVLGASGHPMRRLRRLVRGTAALASRGTAPRHPLNQGGVPGAPLLLSVTLPWAELRRLSDDLDARPHELVVALLAHASVLLLQDRGLLTPGLPLRAMIPVAMRTPRLDRIFGNWTGSLALDLPTAPMSAVERVAVVRSEMRDRAERGEAHAAAAVMMLAGRLPFHLHRWFARAVYGRRFFNTIVSYMPAARGPRWAAGARVRSFTPVLPLTEGVPLTVGIIVADGRAGFGFLVDEGLGIDRASVRDAVARAFAEAGGDLSAATVEER